MAVEKVEEQKTLLGLVWFLVEVALSVGSAGGSVIVRLCSVRRLMSSCAASRLAAVNRWWFCSSSQRG